MAGESIAIASIIVSAASTAAAVHGQRQAAGAQEDAAAANAKAQRDQAARERSASEEQGRRMRVANQAKLGQMRARMAASGVATTTGTPLAMLGEGASRLELGVHDMFNQARSQYQQRQNAANMGVWEGQQASAASNTRGFATALSGLSGVAKDSYDLKYNLHGKTS